MITVARDIPPASYLPSIQRGRSQSYILTIFRDFRTIQRSEQIRKSSISVRYVRLKALNKSVLRRLTWLNKFQFTACCSPHLSQRQAGDKFRPFILRSKVRTDSRDLPRSCRRVHGPRAELADSDRFQSTTLGHFAKSHQTTLNVRKTTATDQK